MRLPPLQPVSDAHFYVTGNVMIHPSAAIAPGVFMQADTDSQIVIAAGVCIGLGAILHAHQGNLEIEEGASLGAGVLLLGSGRIGASACIGSKVTIINSSIEPEQVVKSGSLIGDTSRLLVKAELEADLTEASRHQPEQPQSNPSQSDSSQPGQPDQPDTAPTTSALSNAASAPIYGKAAVSRLIVALFPGGHPSTNLPPRS